MVNDSHIIQTDLKHIWHPCAQMKDFEQCPPLVIHRAKGSYLYTDKGEIIDALSSWWCKSLGHGHPAILAAMKQQLDAFEHVIAANTTHPLLAELGEKLANITNKPHVFFASDGACAVEIALKMALHACQIKGQAHRSEIISLTNSYHGETFATLSVSDIGIYKKPYEGYGLTCHFIQPTPEITDTSDPLWQNADTNWPATLAKLEGIKANVCALIVEPIIQGSGGMRCYSADFLNKLANWAKKNNIYLIADEIMTGIGRTGKWLASEHAAIEPDLICLSKGLTAGCMPFSCVLIDESIYQLFYGDYAEGNSFLHSHTHSGNALAVSAALATLKVIESENMNQQAVELGHVMHQYFQQIATASGKLTNIRCIGAMVAGDLVTSDDCLRPSFRFYQEALKRGALLRPLGNTLYWMPPLNTDVNTIDKLADITLNSLYALYE